MTNFEAIEIYFTQKQRVYNASRRRTNSHKTVILSIIVGIYFRKINSYITFLLQLLFQYIRLIL